MDCQEQLYQYLYNMTTYTNLYLAISDKLGWGEMPASVAIPAIHRIIINYSNVLFEMYGVSEEDLHEDWLEYDMLRIPADFLFGYLHIASIDDCYNQEMCEMFRSLRGEIEQEMFKGASYQEAINEWFK